jgi:hypothetical protein
MGGLDLSIHNFLSLVFWFALGLLCERVFSLSVFFLLVGFGAHLRQT